MKIIFIYPFLSAILLMPVLQGCYNYPAVPDAVNQSSYTDLKKEQQKLIPEDCRILTLDVSEQIALANNPDYLSASHAVNAAWYRFYTSLSSYFPTVNGVYSFSDSQFTPASSASGKNVPSTSMGGGLQTQWVLFNGLVREFNMLVAKHQAKQQEALDRDAKRLLLLSVANAYNNILLARENIRIAESDADFNQKLFNETELKYKVGEVSLSEPLNFKVKYNQALNQLIISRYSFQTSKYVLAALLGLTESDIPSNIEFPPMSPKNVQYSSDITVYLDTALSNRPDLDAFREALIAADYTVWSSWGAFLPTITADMNYGYDRTNYGGHRRTTWGANVKYRSFNYGVSATWTLFNGGQNWFNVKISQAQLAQSQLSVVTKWIQVVEEVRQSQSSYKQAIEQVTLFEETLGLVQKTRDLVEEEYKAGNTNLTRVNQAQSDLVRAEADLASSRVNLENAKAQMEAAIGSR
ncbi:MAG: TolC family protein [Victivallales bacterium]